MDFVAKHLSIYMWVSEWVTDCFNANWAISAISWWEQVTFRWDDDDGDTIYSVLDQHAGFYLYKAATLTLLSVARYVAPLGHISRNRWICFHV